MVVPPLRVIGGEAWGGGGREEEQSTGCPSCSPIPQHWLTERGSEEDEGTDATLSAALCATPRASAFFSWQQGPKVKFFCCCWFWRFCRFHGQSWILLFLQNPQNCKACINFQSSLEQSLSYCKLSHCSLHFNMVMVVFAEKNLLKCV